MKVKNLQLQDKIFTVYDALFKHYGTLPCPLNHQNSFQLLIAVMLSAQCRDERVNMVTETLFKIAPLPAPMAALEPGKIEEIIHSIGLYHAKAANIQKSAQMIMEFFNGQVPSTMEELLQLPGIGRKSANVILGNAFNLPGFPVDTHVKRVTFRLGLTQSTNVEKIEKEITDNFPPEKWCNLSHLLIQFGRDYCNARNPRCAECILRNICPTFNPKIQK